MVKTDTIIIIQAYVNPVGSYLIYHYDLDLAIEEALKCVKQRYNGRN